MTDERIPERSSPAQARIVRQRSGEQVLAHQQATPSGLAFVPRLIRDAGQQATESYLCFCAGLGSRGTGTTLRAAAKEFFRWAEAAGLRLDALRAGHVSEFFAGVAWKPSTKRVYFGALKQLFAQLEADRAIERSPFRGVKPPAVGKNRSLRELRAFLNELDGYYHGQYDNH